MAATFSATAAAPIWSRGGSLGAALVRFTEGWLAPPLFLAIRLWMADIFFRSGLLKIRNLDGAIYLFSEVHPMPLLPPWLAAYLVTTIELVCPTLLVLGLAARLAALPMLAMALVIQFVVGSADPAFYLTEHYYWMFPARGDRHQRPGSPVRRSPARATPGRVPVGGQGRAGHRP
jgi:uncharacterized membrane protein YphA (DoxX/SURF4 family)